MTKHAFLATTYALLALMLAASAWAAPEALAANRPLAIWVLPAAVVLFNLPFGLAPYIFPDRFKLMGTEQAHFNIWTGITALVALVHGLTALELRGMPVDVVGWSGILTGVFLVVTGNYCTKLREGYAYGVVTRWSLASDRAWKRSHRLFGWLLVAHGVASALVSLVYRGPWYFAFFFAGVIIAVLVPTIATYFFWRQDPDRRPPGQKAAPLDA